MKRRELFGAIAGCFMAKRAAATANQNFQSHKKHMDALDGIMPLIDDGTKSTTFSQHLHGARMGAHETNREIMGLL